MFLLSFQTARKIYFAEVERIEEEYETSRRAAKERLLEACDERASKLREEKDSIELNLGQFAVPLHISLYTFALTSFFPVFQMRSLTHRRGRTLHDD
jgi:hypothetical protein